MQRIHSAITLLLASLGLVFFTVTPVAASEQEAVALIQRDFGPAPRIEYMDAQGKMHMVDTSKHKLTAVHFWATWCAPCIDELPQVDDAQSIFGTELQIVAIALDGKNLKKVQDFMSKHQIAHLPPFLDPTLKAAGSAGLKGLPGTLFINQEGEVVAKSEGPLDWQREDVVSFIRTRVK